MLIQSWITILYPANLAEMFWIVLGCVLNCNCTDHQIISSWIFLQKYFWIVLTQIWFGFAEDCKVRYSVVENRGAVQLDREEEEKNNDLEGFANRWNCSLWCFGVKLWFVWCSGVLFWCDVLVWCRTMFKNDARQCSSVMHNGSNVFWKCCQKHLTTARLQWFGKIFSKNLLKSSTKDDFHFENSQIMLGDFQERLLWVLPSNPHPRLKKLDEARSENRGWKKTKRTLMSRDSFPPLLRKRLGFLKKMAFIQGL